MDRETEKTKAIEVLSKLIDKEQKRIEKFNKDAQIPNKPKRGNTDRISIEIEIPSDTYLSDPIIYFAEIDNDYSLITSSRITPESKEIPANYNWEPEKYSTELVHLLAKYPKIKIRCLSINRKAIKLPKKTMRQDEAIMLSIFFIPFVIGMVKYDGPYGFAGALEQGLYLGGMCIGLITIIWIVFWIKGKINRKHKIRYQVTAYKTGEYGKGKTQGNDNNPST